MDPQRWTRIKSPYHAALESTFIRKHCGSRLEFFCTNHAYINAGMNRKRKEKGQWHWLRKPSGRCQTGSPGTPNLCEPTVQDLRGADGPATLGKD
jgi:hypothetical protein